MNIRLNKINELFHFLDEHRSDETKFKEVLEKLENELREEQLKDSNRDSNEYLDSLFYLKEISLNKYFFMKDNRLNSGDIRGYQQFMGNFIANVKLHGLGIAQ